MATIIDFPSRTFGWLLVAALPLGCGSSGIPPAVVETSQAKFDQAQTLVGQKDFAGALPLLNDALESGGLAADWVANGLMLRAQCRLELGELPAALEDIERASQGAEDMSAIHGLRYQYWMKVGDSTKAQSELQLAQKINPSFRLPPSR